ncbi:MAG: O-antigen ligase family protein [Candidatus Coatesbacteria bacterium]|nr:O-antigen ligase family protein [Candidatus Coatesbacteria bacterium]
MTKNHRRSVFRNAARLLILLILLLGPIFFSLWPFWSLNYAKELLFQFIVILLSAFFIADEITKRTRLSELSAIGKPLRLPLALMFAATVQAMIFSGGKFEAGMTFLDILLGFMFTIILIRFLKDGMLKPVPLMFIVILCGVLNSIMAIVQSFGWDFIFGVPVEEVGESAVSARRKVMGFLGNPVFVSEYISAVVPLTLAYILILKSRFRKIVSGLVLVLLIVGVLITMTRAPAIATVIGFGVFTGLLSIVAKGTTRLRKQKLVVGSILLIIVLIYAGAFLKYSAVLDRYAEQASFDRRLSMWANAKAMMWDSPVLGNGLAAFKYLYLDYQVERNLEQARSSGAEKIRVSPRGGLAHAHNEYLHIASEMGAVGIFTLVFLILSVFVFGIRSLRHALKRYKGEQVDNEVTIAVSAMTSIAITLTNAISAFPFHIAPTATLALASFALVLASPARIKSAATEPPAKDEPLQRNAQGRFRIVRIVLVTLTFAVAIWALIIPLKAFMADYHGFIGDALRKTGFNDRALSRYLYASSLTPTDGRLLYKIGLTLSTMGEPEQARAAFMRSQETYNVPALLVSASENALRLGRVFEAIRGFARAQAYTQLQRYNDHLSKIYLGLSEQFTDQGRFDLAIGCLEEARALAPSVQILKQIAEVQDKRGTLNDAAQTRIEILDMDRFEIESAFKLGEYYESQGNLLDARKFFEITRRLDPDYRDVGGRIISLILKLSSRANAAPADRARDLYLTGKLALEYGQPKRAVELLGEVASMGVNEPQAHYFIGKAMEKEGNKTEARLQYREAFSLDPHDARPLIELIEIADSSENSEDIEWVQDRVKNFKPKYQLNKSFATDGPGPNFPGPQTESHRETLRGISLDEFSIQWEDDISMTILWESLPLKGVGQDTVEYFKAARSDVLKFDQRFVVVKHISNLIKRRDAFTQREGMPSLMPPGEMSGAKAGPTAQILRTGDGALRAVCYSDRIPIDSDSDYILFYKVWSSSSGAYLGKAFYDQNGERLLYNRNRSNYKVLEWENNLDYFTPPEGAWFIMIFLALEHSDSGALFDQIVLTPIPRIADIRMQ